MNINFNFIGNILRNFQSNNAIENKTNFENFNLRPANTKIRQNIAEQSIKEAENDTKLSIITDHQKVVC